MPLSKLPASPQPVSTSFAAQAGVLEGRRLVSAQRAPLASHSASKPHFSLSVRRPMASYMFTSMLLTVWEVPSPQ